MYSPLTPPSSTLMEEDVAVTFLRTASELCVEPADALRVNSESEAPVSKRYVTSDSSSPKGEVLKIKSQMNIKNHYILQRVVVKKLVIVCLGLLV